MTVKLVSHLLVVLLPVMTIIIVKQTNFIMTITEYKELCKKDVLKIGQDVKEIKLGTNVRSKIHDDLTGSVVLLDRSNDYAVVMTDIIEYEMMTVECFLSDLEVA